MDKLKLIIDIINKIQIKGINENDFVKYKKIFLRDLNRSYRKYRYCGNSQIIDECINNFLYDEELMTLSNEYDACKLIIYSINFKEFNKRIVQEFNNKNLILVINRQ